MATIYIIAPFDPIPGEPSYPLRFATLKRCLEDKGHRCIWWTSSWDHASKAERSLPEISEDIRLLEVPPYQSNVSFARIRNHRHLAKAYVKEVQQAIVSGRLPSPDLQLISMPPLETAQAAFRIQKEQGGRVVLDIMDTWPDTFFQVLPLPSRQWRERVGRWVFAPYRRMLQRALESCDAVTAQSSGFVDWAKQYGLGAKQQHVCYLGADLPERASARQFKQGEELRLAYIGAMGTSYDLETLLRAIKQLVVEGCAIRLELAGAGRKEAWMRQFVEKEGLREQVTFHGYLAKADLFALLDDCHLGVVPLFPESGVTVPYKACEYASQGLGMLYCLGGELDEMLRQAGAGLRYEAGDVDSLVEQIQTYYKKPELVAQQSQASFQVAQTHFDRSVSYPKLAEFLEGLLAEEAGNHTKAI